MVKKQNTDKKRRCLLIGIVLFFVSSTTFAALRDFSDAPASYGHPRHTIVSGVYLGFASPDAEITSQPTQEADGDDSRGSDDDDILSLPVLTHEQEATFTLFVKGESGYLQAWIDFDANGRFDVGEQIASNLQDDGTGEDATANDGFIVFKITVPADATTRKTYARFRWSTMQNLDSTATADDGEVEDYALTIIASATSAVVQDSVESDDGLEGNGKENNVNDERLENTEKSCNSQFGVDDVSADADCRHTLRRFAVTGRVYKDANVDGVNNDAEGVSILPVVLLDVNNNTCTSTKTDAQGRYVFTSVLAGDYLLYEASRERVPVPKNCDVMRAKNPANYRSTTLNVLPQFSVIDADITGKDFGDVKIPVFSSNHKGVIVADDIVLYAHKLTANSAGTVIFSVRNKEGKTRGWSSTLHQDNNCNGKLEKKEKNRLISPLLPMMAGQVICLINNVYAPAAVDEGESYTNSINAKFEFNGATLAGDVILKVTDRTTVARYASTANDSTESEKASGLELIKTVENITQGAVETDMPNQVQSGDVLMYRIYYSNTGKGVITNLVINDVIPELAVLQSGSAKCETASTDLTCSPNRSAMPNLQWLFKGNLKIGESSVVSYRVKVK